MDKGGHIMMMEAEIFQRHQVGDVFHIASKEIIHSYDRVFFSYEFVTEMRP